MSEKIVNSVKKALDILDILIFEDIDRRGISLKELSERSGIRPNTLHNILKTMKQCGFSRKGISRKPGSVCPEKNVTPPVLKLMPQEMLKTAETIKYIAQ